MGRALWDKLRSREAWVSKPMVFVWVVIVIGIIAFISSAFIVDETQQVIITQFGRPVGNPITEAGLYFKVPFIQRANYFDKRILEWDGDANQIPTKDKRFIWVDTTARWKIVDPLQFFRSVRDEIGAQARLDDIIDAAVRDAINSNRLIEIVRTTNRIVEQFSNKQDKTDAIQLGLKERITRGREEIRKEIFARASKMVKELGIELIDVQIKRVNYVEEVRRKVYERMKAERKRAAEEYRSQGRGEQARIEGQTERELKKIMSEAYRKAQIIKGEADARALKIYADAYSKGEEFFEFIKSLDAYKEMMDKNSVIILSTGSSFLKFLISPEPSNNDF